MPTYDIKLIHYISNSLLTNVIKRSVTSIDKYLNLTIELKGIDKKLKFS